MISGCMVDANFSFDMDMINPHIHLRKDCNKAESFLAAQPHYSTDNKTYKPAHALTFVLHSLQFFQ